MKKVVGLTMALAMVLRIARKKGIKSFSEGKELLLAELRQLVQGVKHDLQAS